MGDLLEAMEAYADLREEVIALKAEVKVSKETIKGLQAKQEDMLSKQEVIKLFTIYNIEGRSSIYVADAANEYILKLKEEVDNG